MGATSPLARSGVPAGGETSGRGVARRLARQIRKNGVRSTAAGVVLLVLLTAVLAPYLAPDNPVQMSFGHFLEPPSLHHVLGTDEAGRDILSRIVYGARISITIGVLAAGLGAVAGVTMGLVAGYYGGPLDSGAVWLIDVLLSFPGILLAVLIAVILGAGLVSIVAAIGIWSVPAFARLARGSALGARRREYVEAGRAAGASDVRILVRHILPNSVGPILVYATIVVGRAILTAAALSFIGIGVPPPTPEWGAMVSTGQLYMRSAPHVVIFPGCAIVVTVLAFNLLGDAVKDALDPPS